MNTADHSLDQAVAGASRIQLATRHIQSARDYTLSLIEDLEPAEWFWTPDPAVTHIAWQIGHMAFGQYGLVLFRQRGRQPGDAELMSGSFRKRFAKGSTPETDPAYYPPLPEIRQTFDRIHACCLKELAGMDEQGLDDPVEPPHAAFATRLGALLFAANHEMLHAGQIGLLRRLMGKPPVR